MSDTVITVGIFLVSAVLVGIWYSKRGDNVRYVSAGPSKEEIAAQRERFSNLTIKELKKYIQTKGKSGRLPTKKADLVEVAIGLWTGQPW
jgi:hypothetical protein